MSMQVMGSRNSFQQDRPHVAEATHQVAGSSNSNLGRRDSREPLISPRPIALVAPSETAPLPSLAESHSCSASDFIKSICMVISLITTVAAVIFFLITFLAPLPGLLTVAIFSCSVAVGAGLLSILFDT